MKGILFDHARTARIGLPEAVFCQGKPRESLLELLRAFGRGSGRAVLFTRLQAEIFASFPDDLRERFDFHALSGTAFGETMPKKKHGRVAIVSAGTADGAVAFEAARTLDFLGMENTVLEDSGVAGLWRLASRLDEVNSHDAIIVVAGLDAALASVMGGLTGKPIIAVPTSVGYGMADSGRAALSSMLVSCAPGVAVMNIDNGYGAACAAARIVNLLVSSK